MKWFLISVGIRLIVVAYPSMKSVGECVEDGIRAGKLSELPENSKKGFGKKDQDKELAVDIKATFAQSR